ncbi:MAG: TRAP transporter substrate-binding protein [Gammaproteobacteria bacterium]|nr:TRAP transporter substrate-binding protein [Gammaproteobacteria bacterium]MDE0649942.1 TRAP transporter substrate-binding protein [Gammaproteobacteria bacterium]
MERRAFLGKAAVGAAAAGVLAASCGGEQQEAAGGGAPAVITNPNVRWRLASSYPRTVDAIFDTATRAGESLSAMTDGRFQLRVYEANELVPAFEVMDAVQQGTVQVGHSPSYYYTGKAPVLAFDTCVPFGLTSRQQHAWLYDAGGLELISEIFSDFNIIPLPAGNTGAQMGGWFRREINTPADLNGLKMRIPGLGAEVMDRLGVTVQNLAAQEIYPALERGAIDATEWVGPYDDEKLGFQNAARFYYYPGWWEPGPSTTFQVNLDAWNSIPSTYQEAFRVAVRSAAHGVETTYDSRNPAALRRLVEGGVQLRAFSPEIMEVSRVASQEILEERAAADATYRRVYDHWSAFRTEAFEWFGRAEWAYASAAFGQNA